VPPIPAVAAESILGAVLAGGRSRRFGSPKTLATVGGASLLELPLRALLEAFGTAVVVCKPGTPLPSLPSGVAVWHDDDPIDHPLSGILAALKRHRGRVAVLACDMPSAGAGLMRRLAAAPGPNALARSARGLEPLAAIYHPSATAGLAQGLATRAPLRATVAKLAPIEVPASASELANINHAADLAEGERPAIRTTL